MDRANPVCPMHYINSGIYVPGDETPGVERVQRVHSSAVKLYQTNSPDEPAGFQFLGVLEIRVLSKVNVG